MFDAYKIGIKIAVTENVTKTLFGMMGAFKGVQKEADILTKKLNGLSKIKAITGTALLGVAGLSSIVLRKSVKPANDYLTQIDKMNIAGMKHAEIIKSVNQAWAIDKNVPTSNVSENLAAILQTRMVFGHTKDAIDFLSEIQKSQAVLRFVTGNNTDESYELSKSLEMRGATKNLSEFSKQMNMMTKSIIASGGKVTPSDFLTTFKYGNSAAQGWSDFFTYEILPTAIQEVKSKGGSGGRAGTALMSSMQAMVGGVISQKSLTTYHKLGLLDLSKEIFNKVGSLKGIEPMGIKGASLFVSNPFSWVDQYLRPALIKSGYNTPQKQQEILPYLFGNRTAQFIMGQFLLQPWKFQRDQRLIEQTKGLDQSYGIISKNPGVSYGAFNNQLTNLLTSIGKVFLPFFIRQLTGLNKILQTIISHGGNAEKFIKGFGIFMFVLGSALTALFSPILATGMIVVGIVFAIVNVFEKLFAFFKTLPPILHAVGGLITHDFNGSGAASINPAKTFTKATGLNHVGDVYIDGEKTGKIISRHQANAATKATNNISHFDTSMGLQNINYNFVGGR